MLRLLLLSPAKLSCLLFTQSDENQFYVQATAQQKARRALPEEIVRQLVILSLIQDYKYSEDRIRIEWPIQMGRTKKRADIVILGHDGSVLVVLETKVETDKNSMDQLKSYMQMEGAKYGAVISATSMECIQMRSAKDFIRISDIPLFNLTQSQISDSDVYQEGEKNIDFINAVEQHIGNQKYLQDGAENSPLIKIIGIEKFERVNKLKVNITIKGASLLLPIWEIDSYAKLKKQFSKVGVVLNPRIKVDEWYELFSQLLEKSPVPSCIEQNASNVAKDAEGQVEVFTAILSNRVGFCGGWVASHELDSYLRECRLDQIISRNRRRELMSSLGYTIHPSLFKGRISNPLRGVTPLTRPILYLTTDHPALKLTKPAAILNAYLEAQKESETVQSS